MPGGNDNLEDTLAQENEELCSLQLELIDSAKRELTNFRKEPQNRRTITVYKRRMANLNEYRTEFRKYHNQIIRNNLAKTDAYFSEDIYSTFDEAYLAAFAEIQTAIDQLTPRPTRTTNTNNHNNDSNDNDNDSNDRRTEPTELECNLPKLMIPKFSGDQSKWLSFYDAFSSSIHNNARFSKSKKFQYLRGVITGEPELFIRHLVTSDETYDEAWQLLLDNYNDTREMFKHQMRIFSSQTAIKTEVVVAIKQLLYLTQSCINAISKMDIDVDASSQMFAYFTLEKLPIETHAFCEQSFGSTNDIPTWDMLSKALKSRIKTLQAIATNPNSSTSTQSGKSTNKQNVSVSKSKNGHSWQPINPSPIRTPNR